MIRRLSFLCAAVLSFACGPTATSIDGDLDIADQELGVVKACSSFATPRDCNARSKRCEWVGASCPEPLPPGVKSCSTFGQCVNIKPVVMDGGTGTADAGTVISVDAGTVTHPCPAGQVLVTQLGGTVVSSKDVSDQLCVAVTPKCMSAATCDCLPKELGPCSATPANWSTSSVCICDNGIR